MKERSRPLMAAAICYSLVLIALLLAHGSATSLAVTTAALVLAILARALYERRADRREDKPDVLSYSKRLLLIVGQTLVALPIYGLLLVSLCWVLGALSISYVASNFWFVVGSMAILALITVEIVDLVGNLWTALRKRKAKPLNQENQ